MSTAIDRVLDRQRAARMLRQDGGAEDRRRLEKEHQLELGSVVLRFVRSIGEAGSWEAFQLYAGLGEHSDVPIYKYKRRVGDWVGYDSFYLTSEGGLVYETLVPGSDGVRIKRVDLDTLEGFLNVDLRALEGLHGEILQEGFWDRLATKLANWGKPGYENVWRNTP